MVSKRRKNKLMEGAMKEHSPFLCVLFYEWMVLIPICGKQDFHDIYRNQEDVGKVFADREVDAEDIGRIILKIAWSEKHE